MTDEIAEMVDISEADELEMTDLTEACEEEKRRMAGACGGHTRPHVS